MTRKAAARGRRTAARRTKGAARTATRTGRKTASARASKAAQATVERKRPAARREVGVAASEPVAPPSTSLPPGPRRERKRGAQSAAANPLRPKSDASQQEPLHSAQAEEEEDLDWLAEDEDPRSQIVEDEDDDWTPGHDEEW